MGKSCNMVTCTRRMETRPWVRRTRPAASPLSTLETGGLNKSAESRNPVHRAIVKLQTRFENGKTKELCDDLVRELCQVCPIDSK
jgi:hypothetical protein